MQSQLRSLIIHYDRRLGRPDWWDFYRRHQEEPFGFISVKVIMTQLNTLAEALLGKF